MNTAASVILVTGANSGIGLACAEYLSSKGNHVYGIGRNAQYKTSRFLYYPADVSNEDAVKKIVSYILEKEKHIDILINNAGIHVLGAIELVAHDIARQLFDCNFFGSLNMIRAVLPSMRQRK